MERTSWAYGGLYLGLSSCYCPDVFALLCEAFSCVMFEGQSLH